MVCSANEHLPTSAQLMLSPGSGAPDQLSFEFHNLFSTDSNGSPLYSISKCFNCGTTRSALWRRGLSGELNCNACSLHFKQRNGCRRERMLKNHGKGWVWDSQKTVGAVCRTAAPLWKKEDMDKTVYNAYDLNHKRQGSARPISMKWDVNWRSHYDARRANSLEDLPTGSFILENDQLALAPDVSTYEYIENVELQSAKSEVTQAFIVDYEGTIVFTNAFYQLPEESN